MIPSNSHHHHTHHNPRSGIFWVMTHIESMSCQNHYLEWLNLRYSYDFSCGSLSSQAASSGDFRSSTWHSPPLVPAAAWQDIGSTGSTGSIKMVQYLSATNQMFVTFSALILTVLKCFGGLKFSYLSLRYWLT